MSNRLYVMEPPLSPNVAWVEITGQTPPRRLIRKSLPSFRATSWYTRQQSLKRIYKIFENNMETLLAAHF